MTVIDDILEIDCPYCAEKINKKARKCKHCNELIDQTLRELHLLKSEKKDVYVTNSAAATVAALMGMTSGYFRRTKAAAVLWCLFLGGIGAHKFYLGRTGSGVVYLLFFWTTIPLIASFFELIYLLMLPQQEFDRRFNSPGFVIV